ncbi:hypothetical protein ACW2Q0_04685 [Nocardia sp. R16R-3T]
MTVTVVVGNPKPASRALTAATLVAAGLRQEDGAIARCTERWRPVAAALTSKAVDHA